MSAFDTEARNHLVRFRNHVVESQSRVRKCHKECLVEQSRARAPARQSGRQEVQLRVLGIELQVLFEFCGGNFRTARSSASLFCSIAMYSSLQVNGRPFSTIGDRYLLSRGPLTPER